MPPFSPSPFWRTNARNCARSCAVSGRSRAGRCCERPCPKGLGPGGQGPGNTSPRALGVPYNVRRSGTGLFQTLHGIAENNPHGLHFRFVAILPTRPEKSPEAILLTPGHDMNVKVRHALADGIVDGKEGAFRSEPFFYGQTKGLGGGEQGPDQDGR